MAGHYLVALLVTSATTFFLGMFVVLRDPRRSLNRIFGLYSLSIALWSIGQALHSIAPNVQQSLWWAHLSHYGVVFIPAFFVHFVVLYLSSETRRTRRVLIPCYLISFFFASLVGTPLYIAGVNAKFSLKYFVEPGPMYLASVAFFSICVVGGLLMLFRGYRSAAGPNRNQMKFLCWSTLFGYLGGMPNFLLVFDVELIPLNPFGTYAVPVYVLITAYTIVRHQLMDIRVFIRKGLVYSVLIACITASHLVMVLAVERGFQGFFGYRSFIATVIVAFLIAIFFNPLRNRIQTLVDRALFHATPAELAEQREQLLTEVRRGEQMKAVGIFAAGLAHEIKNPLASVKTFTDHLDSRYSDPAFRAKFKRIVGGEVDRINRIVQQLLDFSRPMPPKLRPIEVARLLDETLEFLSNELVQHQVEVHRHYSGSGRVLGDAQQIKQVFLNLFLNSLHAMNGHGRLDVQTSAEHSNLVVTIKDNGLGISPKDLQKIFDPFFTTKMRGTGLGLTVSRSIVQEHGGQIEVDSQPGRGTRFKLSLPLVV